MINPYKKNSKVLQTASISFDLSVLSIYPPLIKGSTIVSLKSNNEELVPWKIVNKEKINIICKFENTKYTKNTTICIKLPNNDESVE